MSNITRAGWFAAGTLFGAVGLKLLASEDAVNVYVHATAAGLRVKDQVMDTVTNLQESASDILASAKDLNEQRAAAEAEARANAEVVDESEFADAEQTETETEN